MIWIVVCDGSIAKIFEKEHRFSSLKHLKSFDHSHESTHEHGKDKPGRHFNSPTSYGHTYKPKSDWHDRQKVTFVEHISSYLLKSLRNKLFSTIYFICPPKLIGIFRDNFEKHIDTQHKNQITIKEIDKDLTHSDSNEINKLILKEEGWE